MDSNEQQAVSLAPLTTLKVGGAASYCAVIKRESELAPAVARAQALSLPLYVLGGGSNILVSDHGVDGYVLKIELAGVTAHELSGVVYLTAAAGENFDDVVAYAVEEGWWGLENLSHIPGTVGATPVQNVGAYGVEIKDVVELVRAFDTLTGEFVELTPDACAFSYRDSLFKQTPGRYIITAVTFRLATTPQPRVTYKDLAAVFPGGQATVGEVREAVIAIRAKKFPNWHEVGTAGSFFKNPIIAEADYLRIAKEHNALPVFPVGNGQVKIPLGYVLDKILALRGTTIGRVGTYEGQALVLVTEPGATAAEVEQFANTIVARVKEKLGITVEWEVTKWGV